VTRLSAAIAAAVLCLVPTWAVAQTAADQQSRPVVRSPARPRQKVGVRGFVTFDGNALTASETFTAVLGTSTLRAVGAGGEVLNIWKGLFVRIAASSMKHAGGRVVVVDHEAFPLGIPLTIEMQPVEFGAGWRKPIGRRRASAVYVGGGLLHMVYRESSEFAAVGENTNTTFNGTVVFGGVDLPIWRFVVAGGELQYRTLPNAIGSAGAAAAFGETDLGGATARVMFGVRF
jgi:hypothetical protein